ncbi:MAG: ABC transporter ATP-binding protein [Turicibacter sp.]|nr:ABC transporter ATP-binding protein [Turicibacter sp.]MBQ8992972.1 ABC transporter ATP-binding protein [Turicibacter sp.]MEE0880810.1 ABC transporter ATP-binding protein [Turicibacter sp.]
MKNVLEVKQVNKEYGLKGFKTSVLKDINLNVEKGDFISIMGPSGAGKTTLLNLMSTLDKPTTGQIILDGHDLSKVSSKKLAMIRRDQIGFIFQDYSLLDNMTILDNIALPLALGRKKTNEIIQKATEMAQLFGLEKHLNKYPYELSGGQKQRTAAARALITNPSVIFADEPTGALDSRSSTDLLECLKRINEQTEATIIMVTHDPFSASYSKRVYMLSDGAIKCQISKGENRKVFYSQILDLLATMGGAN